MSQPFPPIDLYGHTAEDLQAHLTANPQMWLSYINQLLEHIRPLEQVQTQLTIVGSQYQSPQSQIEELKAELRFERGLRIQAAVEATAQTAQSPVSTMHAPAPTSEPTPTPTSEPTSTPPNHRSERLPDPAPFSGDRKELRGFVQAIGDKMSINRDRYPTPAERVVYTISRLTSTARAQVLPHAKSNGTYDFKDYTDILDLLSLAFGDPNLRRTARSELFKLRQTNKEFSVHIAEFQRLAAESETPPAHLIDLLEESLSQELRSMLKHLYHEYVCMIELSFSSDSEVPSYIALSGPLSGRAAICLMRKACPSRASHVILVDAAAYP